MSINFDFSDLQAFLSLMELGSFVRAAEQLNVSQSAITRRISKLEQSLDTRLFERTTRSIKPTLAARIFYEKAHHILNETHQAIETLADETTRYDYQKNAIVSVATLPTVTHDLLPRAIDKFVKQGNKARIQILDMFANDILDAVSNGEADFGITFMGTEEPGLTFKKLRVDNFVVAIQPQHPLSKKKTITWRDLNNEKLIVPWKGGGNRLLIDNTLASHNFALNWQYQVRHASSAISLVETGIGLAVLPESAIANHRRPIIYRKLVKPSISRIIGSVRRTGHRLSQMAETLCSQLD